MQISAVSPTLGGKRFLSSDHSSADQASVSPLERSPLIDDVLLNNPSASDLSASIDMETLLALMQGILETVEGTPLALRDALRTNRILLDTLTVPSWLQAARHAIATPDQHVLRLHAEGVIAPLSGEGLHFALDMQLLNAPFLRLHQAMAASFLLGLGAGKLSGAEVSFTLIPTALLAESDETAAWQSHQPSEPGLFGCPLFAQFLLDRQSDILCIAARLLPTVKGNAPRPHLAFAGDGSYVTQEGGVGDTHQVDVSA